MPDDHRKKVLLSGASGFLGRHLMRCVPENVELHLLLRSTLPSNITFEKDRNSPVQIICDLAKPDELSELLGQIKVDAVLHTAAVSDAAACENDRRRSFRVNVASSALLAKYAGQHNIPILFCSTDLVFDGLNAPYNPSDRTHAVMEYGRQKAEAENQIKMACDHAIIARLPLMFGRNMKTDRGQIDYLINACKKQTPVGLFTDELRSPAHAARVAEGLWQWLFSANSGIWHFGGPQSISRYDFGLKIAAAFGLDYDNIKMRSQAKAHLGAARPPDVSLNSSATFNAGWVHPDLDTELQLLCRE